MEEQNTEGLLKEIQSELKKLKQDNAVLLQIADKKALGLYYSRHQQKMPGRINYRVMPVTKEDGTMEKKMVVAWKTVKDEVYKDPKTGRWVEDQIVKIIYEDGTSIDMPLMTWYRQYELKPATVISKKTDEVTGMVSFKVKRDEDSKEVELNVLYVN
jgi:hypothetical protein